MESTLALTIVCLIFALGDFISIKTRSTISTMLVALVLLLLGFWTKLPPSLFEDAGLLKIGGILIPFLIAHMGTLLSIEDLIDQWKTVVISLGAILGIALALIFFGTTILGREYAISAAPPLAGGVVAAIIMGERASSLGMEHIAVFTTLIVVLQQFIGIPLASILLKKEAKNFLDQAENIGMKEEKIKRKKRKKLFPDLDDRFKTSYFLLAKLSLVVLLSLKISDLSAGVINHFVLALFLGVIFKELGFLESNILVEANAFGLAMLALMAVIFNSLSKASPEILLELIKPLMGSLIIAIIGLAILSFIVGKLLNFSKEMSISIGLTALFGFPGTFILPSEIANSTGKNQEEREAILNHILPKMLVAGFVTVTIASVVLAGLMVNML